MIKRLRAPTQDSRCFFAARGKPNYPFLRKIRGLRKRRREREKERERVKEESSDRKNAPTLRSADKSREHISEPLFIESPGQPARANMAAIFLFSFYTWFVALTYAMAFPSSLLLRLVCCGGGKRETHFCFLRFPSVSVARVGGVFLEGFFAPV